MFSRPGLAMMVAVRTTEKSGKIKGNTRLYIPEDSEI
jgi:hypothetical protein